MFCNLHCHVKTISLFLSEENDIVRRELARELGEKGVIVFTAVEHVILKSMAFLISILFQLVSQTLHFLYYLANALFFRCIFSSHLTH